MNTYGKGEQKQRHNQQQLGNVSLGGAKAAAGITTRYGNVMGRGTSTNHGKGGKMAMYWGNTGTGGNGTGVYTKGARRYRK